MALDNLESPTFFRKFALMASIYLHIPFCRKMCGYCDFFKTARLDRVDEVLAAMEQEMEQEVDFLTAKKISTIYFGGGTPSLLEPQQLERLMRRMEGLYDLSGVGEITLEANPDDLTPEYLRALRGLGINRLSIGVQSFDDATLEFMNRRHTGAEAVTAIEAARAAGFDNIAIDLIFGVSGFGGRALEESILRTVELGVEHVAAYHLTIESGTMFARRVAKGEFSAVAESVSEREYEVVRRTLVEAGYNHYEISNYAREGCESRHNSAYWSGAEYLGIGAGAHSFSGRGEWGVRRWNDSGLDGYINKCGDERYEVERLTRTERRNEIVMTSLRRTCGLDLLDFQRVFGLAERGRLESDAARAVAQGDIVSDGEWMRIPTDRFLRSDMIIESLFYL